MAALTPDLAIAYVRELSADVRAVVVFAADGTLLAGPPGLAAPAAAFLASAPGVADLSQRAPDGLVVAARGTAHALVAVAGPLALAGPTALDARVAVDALDGAEPPASAPTTPPAEGAATAGTPSADERLRAANAVISATHRGI